MNARTLRRFLGGYALFLVVLPRRARVVLALDAFARGRGRELVEGRQAGRA